MNRRLGADASLNAPVRADTEAGEWQYCLADDAPSKEEALAEIQELSCERIRQIEVRAFEKVQKAVQDAA